MREGLDIRSGANDDASKDFKLRKSMPARVEEDCDKRFPILNRKRLRDPNLTCAPLASVLSFLEHRFADR